MSSAARDLYPPLSGDDLPVFPGDRFGVSEAEPSPEPGPQRDLLVALSEQQARRAEDQMLTALEGYLDRFQGVVLATLNGPRARKGTRWWARTGKPEDKAALIGVETKSRPLDPDYIVPDKLVKEAESVLRPVALRVAVDAGADVARRLGVSVPDDRGDGMFAVDHQALEAAIENAVTLLLGSVRGHAAEVRKEILRADSSAESLDEVLDLVEQAHKRGGNWLRMTGRTLANALRNEAAWKSAQALGVGHAQWLCVSADTEVWAPSVLNVARRWSAEGLLRIATTQNTGGRRFLSVTPDHPMLCQRGWVPARELHPGDHLVRSPFVEGNAVGDPDEQRSPTKISEVFHAANLKRPSERVMRASVDLDGDGDGGYVDVVPVDGELRDRLQPTISEPAAQRFLILSDLDMENLLPGACDREGILPARGGLRVFGGGPVQTGGGPIAPGDAPLLDNAAEHHRGSAETLDDGIGRLARPVGIGDGVLVESPATPARFLRGTRLRSGFGTIGESALGGLRGGEQHSCRLQATPDGFGTDAGQGSGDLTRRLTSLVTTDEIVDIEFDPMPTHVYDLQTATGWFVADGYIVHNSRRDDKVRKTHRHVDGTVRRIDDEFQVGSWFLRFPGDPKDLPASASEVNGCRCGLLMRRPDKQVTDAVKLLNRQEAGGDPRAVRRLLAASAVAPEVPMPLDAPPAPSASQVALKEPVVGYRALDAVLSAIPGQRLTWPGTLALGLAAPATFSAAAPMLAVAIPAGSIVTVVGGSVVLPHGATLEVVGVTAEATQARLVQ